MCRPLPIYATQASRLTLLVLYIHTYMCTYSTYSELASRRGTTVHGPRRIARTRPAHCMVYVVLGLCRDKEIDARQTLTYLSIPHGRSRYSTRPTGIRRVLGAAIITLWNNTGVKRKSSSSIMCNYHTPRPSPPFQSPNVNNYHTRARAWPHFRPSFSNFAAALLPKTGRADDASPACAKVLIRTQSDASPRRSILN